MLRVFGRKAVLEALLDPAAEVELVLLDRTARGAPVEGIVDAARARGVALRRVDVAKVHRVSGNHRHDQGVVAELVSSEGTELAAWLAAQPPGPLSLVLLDGVTNPANVGMVVRTVTAAGLDGLVLPRSGSPELGPLAIKASAGVAFRATVLGADDPAAAAATLRDHGVTVVGLRGDDADDLFRAPLPDRAAYVLGNESTGVTVDCDLWRAIPMANDVESLNVAVAAGVVAFEVARRRG